MEVKGRIRLSKNNATDANGLAIPPLLSDLDYGQVAVNYSKDDPCLFFKKNGVDGDEIVKIVTEEKIAQTLSEILGGAAADLDTLKELLDKFIGSDNDVLNLITTIQTEVAKKADKTTLSNHTGSTSNPHGVTAEQTGALPVNGKAADTNRFAGKVVSNFIKTGLYTNLTYDNLATNSILSISSYGKGILDGDLTGLGVEGSLLNVNGVDGNNQMSFQIVVPSNENKGLYYSSWYSGVNARREFTRVWDSKNCNKDTVDWTADSLFARRLRGLNAADNKDGHALDILAGHGNGTDKSGGSLFLYAGCGTGKGGGGGIFFNTATTGATSGSGVNPAQTRMLITNSGNVGIGTTSPTYKLDVTGDIRANKTFTNNANAAQIHITGADATASNAGDVFTGITFGYAPTGSSAGASIVARHNSGNGTALLFHTTTNWGSLFERMRISQNGNVGIGINNPTYRLHSVDTIKAPSFSGTKIRIECNEEGVSKDRESEINNYQSNLFLQHNSSRNLIMCHGGGSVGIGTLSPTSKFHVVGTSKLIGNTSIGGNLAVEGAINSVGQISTEDEVIATGDIKSTAGGIIAAGEVIAYKAATALQEGTPSGSLGIVYDGLDSTEPDVALSANQGRILNESVTAVRSLATEAATTATWSNIAGTPSEFAPTAHNHYDATYVSDRRLKSNIETIENGLEHCLSMNPVQYDWTQEALDRFGFASTKAYGMIAQEMELLLPHVTKKIDDHTLSIDYIQTIPFLVSAIKQLHALIKEANINNNTKTRAANRAYAEEKTNAQVIADLRAEIEELKNMINAK